MPDNSSLFTTHRRLRRHLTSALQETLVVQESGGQEKASWGEVKMITQLHLVL